jgi:hypothetical protein
MTNDLEAYYSLARPGTLACIHRRDPAYGDQFIFDRVIEVNLGKIKTSYGIFWLINGERTDNRWYGDMNRLVLPTMTRLELEEKNIKSIYQFGTDRVFELAAARAVLERRKTKMPDVPPPPVPTLEEAEAELRDATIYWMSIDQTLDSPRNSIRLRREASERLSAAKTIFRLATEAQAGHQRRMKDFDLLKNRPSNELSSADEGAHESRNFSKASFSVNSSLKYMQSRIGATGYVFNYLPEFGEKRD